MDHANSGKCKTIPFYYYADNTLKDRNLYSRFQSVLGEAKSLHYCQRIEISFINPKIYIILSNSFTRNPLIRINRDPDIDLQFKFNYYFNED